MMCGRWVTATARVDILRQTIRRDIKKQKARSEKLNFHREICVKFSWNRPWQDFVRKIVKMTSLCKLLTDSDLPEMIFRWYFLRPAKEPLLHSDTGRFRWWYGAYQALKQLISERETGSFARPSARCRYAECTERAFRRATGVRNFSVIGKIMC